jgi:hypothetical protein
MLSPQFATSHSYHPTTVLSVGKLFSSFGFLAPASSTSIDEDVELTEDAVLDSCDEAGAPSARLDKDETESPYVPVYLPFRKLTVDLLIQRFLLTKEFAENWYRRCTKTKANSTYLRDIAAFVYVSRKRSDAEILYVLESWVELHGLDQVYTSDLLRARMPAWMRHAVLQFQKSGRVDYRTWDRDRKRASRAITKAFNNTDSLSGRQKRESRSDTGRGSKMLQVLALQTQGLKNSEIAEQLGMDRKAVSKHICKARKLGLVYESPFDRTAREQEEAQEAELIAWALYEAGQGPKPKTKKLWDSDVVDERYFDAEEHCWMRTYRVPCAGAPCGSYLITEKLAARWAGKKKVKE